MDNWRPNITSQKKKVRHAFLNSCRCCMEPSMKPFLIMSKLENHNAMVHRQSKHRIEFSSLVTSDKLVVYEMEASGSHRKGRLVKSSFSRSAKYPTQLRNWPHGKRVFVSVKNQKKKKKNKKRVTIHIRRVRYKIRKPSGTRRVENGPFRSRGYMMQGYRDRDFWHIRCVQGVPIASCHYGTFSRVKRELI